MPLNTLNSLVVLDTVVTFATGRDDVRTGHRLDARTKIYEINARCRRKGAARAAQVRKGAKPPPSSIEVAGHLAAAAGLQRRLDLGAYRHSRRAARVEPTARRQVEGARDFAGDRTLRARVVGM